MDTKLLTPVVIALALASVSTVGLSLFLKGEKLALAQTALFVAAVAAGSYRLSQDLKLLDPLIVAFAALNQELQIALSVTIVSVVYFGGSFYAIAADSAVNTASEKGISTPASIDSVVEFDIPSSLPADDKVLFEQVFDK